MIHAHLDLSTAHVSRETMDMLDSPEAWERHGWPAMTIAPYPYGAFVTWPGGADAAGWASLPADLRQVLEYTRKLGAVLVRFDSDGEVTHNLPIYDW